MNRTISLSYRTLLADILEIIIVIAVGLGLFIYASTDNILNHHTERAVKAYNSADFYFIIIYELIVSAVLFDYLRSKHWTWKDFNLHFSISMIGIALLLVAIRNIIGIAGIKTLTALNIVDYTKEPTVLLQSNILGMVLMLIVNSVYEEMLLVGYLFKKLEKYGHPALIIFISFLIRESYHTYQGWGNVPMVLSLSLVFGIYYIRYKKLWPLIIAHCLGNVFVFLNNTYGWIAY